MHPHGAERDVHTALIQFACVIQASQELKFKFVVLMDAQHARNGPLQGRPLKAVLDEFSTCMAAAQRAQGTQQPAESAAAAERLQKLLLEILQFAEAPSGELCVFTHMHALDPAWQSSLLMGFITGPSPFAV